MGNERWLPIDGLGVNRFDFFSSYIVSHETKPSNPVLETMPKPPIYYGAHIKGPYKGVTLTNEHFCQTNRLHQCCLM